MQAVAVMPSGVGGSPPRLLYLIGNPWRGNAYQLAEGKRLYHWFGCPQCHADGQGTARGPALLDGWWNYGPDLVSLYTSIHAGRPGGMPAFRDRLTTEQVWQLAGYVQVLGA